MDEFKNSNAHQKRVDVYSEKVRRAYQVFYDEFMRAVQKRVNVRNEDEIIFKFKDHPALEAAVSGLLATLSADIRSTILSAIKQEWKFANENYDIFIREALKNHKLPTVSIKHNLVALDAFISRKTGAESLNLSQRIWKYTGQFKQELEMALDVGLNKGKSAQALSREIRSYLNEPEKLFRRVRDKYGQLQLSKNAKAYHPGQGVYRSSYKNAMRLARTEINMAYRTAEHVRRMQLPFVVGIEIRLSNKPDRVKDICDDLVGRYPKEFLWRTWHPNCMCHSISILPTEDEFEKMQQMILDGDTDKIESEMTVKDVPDGFKKWMEDHQESYARAQEKGTLPFFVRDNPKFAKIDKQ